MINLLVVSTSLSILSSIIPRIVKYIVKWFFSESKEEQRIRTELFNLEQEMSAIPMVDEFAKYTRVQRKHTKLRDELKTQTSARTHSRAKAQLFFTYAARIFNGIVILIMMKYYRTEPVIILPKGSLWPLDKILSWPSSYEDSISLVMWMGISTIATSSITN